MSAVNHMHQHTLFGSRYRHLIKESIKLYEGKSRREFRSALRKALQAKAKEKITDKNLFSGIHHVFALTQEVVFEFLYVRGRITKKNPGAIADESLLVLIFEPEEKCLHYPVLEMLTLMLYAEECKVNSSEKLVSLVSNFPQIVVAVREIFDEFGSISQ